MEHSLTPATLSLNRSTPYDWTIIPTVACMVIGGIIAVYAVAISGPIDVDTLATMVALP